MALQLEDVHKETVERLIFLDGVPCMEGAGVMSKTMTLQVAESKKLFEGVGKEIKKVQQRT